MASCNGITVKSISTSKVYLKGTITGLNNSKQYCLHHYYNGAWKNLPNKDVNYTYFSNRTSFDLESIGCYVPTSELVEGAQFEVRCHEVNGNCETRVMEACTKILYYKVISQYTADFLVRDEDKKTVSGVMIDVGGEVIYTDQYGGASIVLDAGNTYYAQCYAPSGYKCDYCDESFYIDSDHSTHFWLITDKCASITCNNTCDGTSLYSQKCVNGLCVKDALIESNSTKCGGGGTGITIKGIPPEIIAVMPAGTTRILIMSLKPLSWANFSGLKSDIPWIVGKVAGIITTGGFIGWECLGVDVVKTSDNKVLMPIFLRRS